MVSSLMFVKTTKTLETFIAFIAFNELMIAHHMVLQFLSTGERLLAAVHRTEPGLTGPVVVLITGLALHLFVIAGYHRIIRWSYCQTVARLLQHFLQNTCLPIAGRPIALIIIAILEINLQEVGHRKKVSFVVTRVVRRALHLFVRVIGVGV